MEQMEQETGEVRKTIFQRRYSHIQLSYLQVCWTGKKSRTLLLLSTTIYRSLPTFQSLWTFIKTVANSSTAVILNR